MRVSVRTRCNRAIYAILLGTGLSGCQLDGTRVATPTLVLFNGRIWTGEEDRPGVRALAVTASRIVAVGDDEEIRGLAGEGTRLVDLEDRRVVPGFIDSHVHMLGAGDELLAPDFRSARSREDFAQRVGRAVATLPAGSWLSSGAWDHENWPDLREPTRDLLDPVSSGHPVFVARLDGHMGVANSLALSLAGIDANTPDPPGGKIVKNPETGEPSGLLKDAAMGLVTRLVPAADFQTRMKRLRAALEHAATLGVTGVHDMQGEGNALDLYQELARRGELTLRVTLYQPLARNPLWRRLKVQRGFGDRFVKVNGFKGFADGSLGSSTALFFEPYLNDPHNHGLQLSDLSTGGALEREVRSSVEGKLQVAIHGIGDRAVHALLDIFERAGGDAPRSRRFRIEHAQHISPDDLDRFAKLGVVASMQPYHAIDDGRWAETRIDERRCETSYAWRDLLDRGAPLAFGSDWPVAPLSPLKGIHAAVTRATLDGKHPGGWFPHQRITVEEALAAYTTGSAHAGFAEDELGTLAPGMLADIVVLDRDILEIEPAEIADTRVVLTIVDGRIVHDAR